VSNLHPRINRTRLVDRGWNREEIIGNLPGAEATIILFRAVSLSQQGKNRLLTSK
jgi:hypothetical protein